MRPVRAEQSGGQGSWLAPSGATPIVAEAGVTPSEPPGDFGQRVHSSSSSQHASSVNAAAQDLPMRPTRDEEPISLLSASGNERNDPRAKLMELARSAAQQGQGLGAVRGGRIGHGLGALGSPRGDRGEGHPLVTPAIPQRSRVVPGTVQAALQGEDLRSRLLRPYASTSSSTHSSQQAGQAPSLRIPSEALTSSTQRQASQIVFRTKAAGLYASTQSHTGRSQPFCTNKIRLPSCLRNPFRRQGRKQSLRSAISRETAATSSLPVVSGTHITSPSNVTALECLTTSFRKGDRPQSGASSPYTAPLVDSAQGLGGKRLHVGTRGRTLGGETQPAAADSRHRWGESEDQLTHDSRDTSASRSAVRDSARISGASPDHAMDAGSVQPAQFTHKQERGHIDLQALDSHESMDSTRRSLLALASKSENVNGALKLKLTHEVKLRQKCQQTADILSVHCQSLRVQLESRAKVDEEGQKCSAAAVKPLLPPTSLLGGYGHLDRIWQIPADDVVLGALLGKSFGVEIRRGSYHGTVVAVKIVYDAGGDSTAALAGKHPGSVDKRTTQALELRFQHEVNVLIAARHPHTVQFLGYCLHPKEGVHGYIVTEYLRSGSVHDLIHGPDRQHLLNNPQWLYRVAYSVCLAMLSLHSRNPVIVHRNLRTKNLLCDEHINVKVAQFSLAIMYDKALSTGTVAHDKAAMKAEEAGGEESGSGGSARGSGPQVALPQMTLSNRCDPKVDVYWYGMVLWELATGEELPESISLLRERPAIPSTASASLCSLIQSCWMQKPSARPAFCEILEILEAPDASDRLFFKADRGGHDTSSERAARTRAIERWLNHPRTGDTAVSPLVYNTLPAPQPPRHPVPRLPLRQATLVQPSSLPFASLPTCLDASKQLQDIARRGMPAPPPSSGAASDSVPPPRMPAGFHFSRAGPVISRNRSFIFKSAPDLSRVLTPTHYIAERHNSETHELLPDGDARGQIDALFSQDRLGRLQLSQSRSAGPRARPGVPSPAQVSSGGKASAPGGTRVVVAATGSAPQTHVVSSGDVRAPANRSVPTDVRPRMIEGRDAADGGHTRLVQSDRIRMNSKTPQLVSKARQQTDPYYAAAVALLSEGKLGVEGDQLKAIERLNSQRAGAAAEASGRAAVGKGPDDAVVRDAAAMDQAEPAGDPQLEGDAAAGEEDSSAVGAASVRGQHDGTQAEAAAAAAGTAQEQAESRTLPSDAPAGAEPEHARKDDAPRPDPERAESLPGASDAAKTDEQGPSEPPAATDISDSQVDDSAAQDALGSALGSCMGSRALPPHVGASASEQPRAVAAPDTAPTAQQQSSTLVTPSVTGTDEMPQLPAADVVENAETDASNEPHDSAEAALPAPTCPSPIVAEAESRLAAGSVAPTTEEAPGAACADADVDEEYDTANSSTNTATSTTRSSIVSAAATCPSHPLFIQQQQLHSQPGTASPAPLSPVSYISSGALPPRALTPTEGVSTPQTPQPPSTALATDSSQPTSMPESSPHTPGEPASTTRDVAPYPAKRKRAAAKPEPAAATAMRDADQRADVDHRAAPTPAALTVQEMVMSPHTAMQQLWGDGSGREGELAPQHKRAEHGKHPAASAPASASDPHRHADNPLEAGVGGRAGAAPVAANAISSELSIFDSTMDTLSPMLLAMPPVDIVPQPRATAYPLSERLRRSPMSHAQVILDDLVDAESCDVSSKMSPPTSTLYNETPTVGEELTHASLPSSMSALQPPSGDDSTAMTDTTRDLSKPRSRSHSQVPSMTTETSRAAWQRPLGRSLHHSPLSSPKHCSHPPASIEYDSTSAGNSGKFPDVQSATAPPADSSINPGLAALAAEALGASSRPQAGTRAVPPLPNLANTQAEAAAGSGTAPWLAAGSPPDLAVTNAAGTSQSFQGPLFQPAGSAPLLRSGQGPMMMMGGARTLPDGRPPSSERLVMSSGTGISSESSIAGSQEALVSQNSLVGWLRHSRATSSLRGDARSVRAAIHSPSDSASNSLQSGVPRNQLYPASPLESSSSDSNAARRGNTPPLIPLSAASPRPGTLITAKSTVALVPGPGGGGRLDPDAASASSSRSVSAESSLSQPRPPSWGRELMNVLLEKQKQAQAAAEELPEGGPRLNVTHGATLADLAGIAVVDESGLRTIREEDGTNSGTLGSVPPGPPPPKSKDSTSTPGASGGLLPAHASHATTSKAGAPFWGTLRLPESSPLVSQPQSAPPGPVPQPSAASRRDEGRSFRPASRLTPRTSLSSRIASAVRWTRTGPTAADNPPGPAAELASESISVLESTAASAPASISTAAAARRDPQRPEIQPLAASPRPQSRSHADNAVPASDDGARARSLRAGAAPALPPPSTRQARDAASSSFDPLLSGGLPSNQLVVVTEQSGQLSLFDQLAPQMRALEPRETFPIADPRGLLSLPLEPYAHAECLPEVPGTSGAPVGGGQPALQTATPASGAGQTEALGDAASLAQSKQKRTSRWKLLRFRLLRSHASPRAESEPLAEAPAANAPLMDCALPIRSHAQAP